MNVHFVNISKRDLLLNSEFERRNEPTVGTCILDVTELSWLYLFTDFPAFFGCFLQN